MPCCARSPGSSLRNAVRNVGVLDITFVTIPLVFEAVNLGYILGFLDPFGYLKADCEDLTLTSHCSWTYSMFHELTSKGSEMSLKLNTYSVFILILFVLIGGIVEAYLVAMLRRGVRDEIHHWCKKWFWIRILLLLVVSLTQLLKFIRSHYNLMFDGIYDLTKLYRIITLIIMKLYMKELELTVGVDYIRRLRKPKKGSLGQDIHILD